MLALDTSALVRRYLTDASSAWVVSTMDGFDMWCGSALCRTEALMVLHHGALTQSHARTLRRALLDDWASAAEIPVDDRCLARAVEIGTTFRLRTVDAIHLAAADRLPRPVHYLTLDSRQIPAAAELGLDVIAPLAP